MKTELKEISATRKQIDDVIHADAVRAVFRSRFKDQIRTEVLRELLPNAVQSAITEHNIEALGEPELNLENSEGLDQLGQQPISFNVNVDVLPEIKLSNYKGLAAPRQTRAVKDEDVEAVIQQLRENSASLQPVEDRGAQVGDTVTANFLGKFVKEPEAEPINVTDVD